MKGVYFGPFSQEQSYYLVISCISVISKSGAGHSHCVAWSKIYKKQREYDIDTEDK